MTPPLVVNTLAAGNDGVTSLWATLSDGSIWRLTQDFANAQSIPNFRDPDIRWLWERIPDIPPIYQQSLEPTS